MRLAKAERSELGLRISRLGREECDEEVRVKGKTTSQWPNISISQKIDREVGEVTRQCIIFEYGSD